jgi:hypothetical protein
MLLDPEQDFPLLAPMHRFPGTKTIAKKRPVPKKKAQKKNPIRLVQRPDGTKIPHSMSRQAFMKCNQTNPCIPKNNVE